MDSFGLAIATISRLPDKIFWHSRIQEGSTGAAHSKWLKPCCSLTLVRPGAGAPIASLQAGDKTPLLNKVNIIPLSLLIVVDRLGSDRLYGLAHPFLFCLLTIDFRRT